MRKLNLDKILILSPFNSCRLCIHSCWNEAASVFWKKKLLLPLQKKIHPQTSFKKQHHQDGEEAEEGQKHCRDWTCLPPSHFQGYSSVEARLFSFCFATPRGMALGAACHFSHWEKWQRLPLWETVHLETEWEHFPIGWLAWNRHTLLPEDPILKSLMPAMHAYRWLTVLQTCRKTRSWHRMSRGPILTWT